MLTTPNATFTRATSHRALLSVPLGFKDPNADRSGSARRERAHACATQECVLFVPRERSYTPLPSSSPPPWLVHSLLRHAKAEQFENAVSSPVVSPPCSPPCACAGENENQTYLATPAKCAWSRRAGTHLNKKAKKKNQSPPLFFLYSLVYVLHLTQRVAPASSPFQNFSTSQAPSRSPTSPPRLPASLCVRLSRVLAFAPPVHSSDPPPHRAGERRDPLAHPRRLRLEPCGEEGQRGSRQRQRQKGQRGSRQRQR